MSPSAIGKAISGLVLVVGLAGFLPGLPAARGQTEFEWSTADPARAGFEAERLEALQESLAGRGTEALLIIRHDRIVLEWYRGDRTANDRHYSASLAKALTGGLSLAVAVDEGRLTPGDRASQYVRQWADDPRRSRITLRQLAQHTSGVEDAGEADANASQNDLPGWKGAFWRGRQGEQPDPITVALEEAPVLFEPGTDHAYSNPGFAVLGYAVTAALERDVRSALRERVMGPIGLSPSDWSVGYGRTFEVDDLLVVANWGGGGFTPRAVARLGRLLLHGGRWEGRQVLGKRAIGAIVDDRMPEELWDRLDESQPVPALGWYTNTNGAWPEVPRDTIVGAGAGHQLLAVIPSLDLIVVRNGGALDGDLSFWQAAHTHLLQPVVAALADPPEPRQGRAPYRPSPVVADLNWAPADDVLRLAEGSDTWPATWGDDGHLYTAYADGWGFEPFVEDKLSLGVARVEGDPPDLEGINIRSSIEQPGDGPRGRKASGILMVDGVLYLWARNADGDGRQSQLAWSEDKGETWTWTDWRFDRFGYPTLLNFGPDYEGARDRYVYVYSPDGPSAYEPADRFILMRVPREHIRERDAYEFFAGANGRNEPTWSPDVEQRAAVFEHRGACLRSGITYNEALGRYLWWQQVPDEGADTRFEGGFGVYDAPEPWGPWTTAYFTERWDIGPGETASFPTKWISDDGRTLHLLFSGDDYFAVRGARLRLRNDGR